jgi:nucleotide-binding universal stress UspA family protein
MTNAASTYQKILVALDGSPLAEEVLPHAAALAAKLDAELVLLQVTAGLTEDLREAAPTGASETAGEVSVDVARRRHSAEKASAEAYLGRTQQQLIDKGLKVTYTVEEGDPSRAIVEKAKQTGSGLIAMSTHGRTGLGRALLGSVSDEVLRTSGLPVLLVRPVD